MIEKKQLLEQGLKYALIQPRYSLFYLVLYFAKTLPLYVLTHDWNINSEKGWTFWIRKLSFSCVICTNYTQLVYTTCITVLFIMWLFITLTLIKLRGSFRKGGNLHEYEKRLFVIISSFFFYGQFLICQYFYSIFVEILFCPGAKVISSIGFYVKEANGDCRTPFYYFIVVIIIFFMIEMSVLSVYISSFIYDSYFSSQNLFVISFNDNDYSSFILPLLQVLLQLEYHTEFKINFIIKCIFRGCFMICYITYMFSHRSIYSHYYMDYFSKFILSLCFWSCIIEWAFVFDYSNGLLYIQEYQSYIITKMLLEVIAAKLTVDFYYKKDNDLIQNFIHKFAAKSSIDDYETINKLFYSLYYRDNSKLLKQIATQSRQLFQSGVHIPKCSKKNQISKCLYCDKFSVETFQRQYTNFIQEHKTKHRLGVSNNVNPSTSDSFPLEFELIETLLLSNAKRNYTINNKKYVASLEMLIIFYLSFKANYYKCLYYIEEIIRSSVFNQSILYQIKIIKLKFSILKEYKHVIYLKKLGIGKETEVISHNERIKTHKEYKSVLRIIKTENVLVNSLQSYLNILKVMNNDKVHLHDFISVIRKFMRSYEMNQKSLPTLLNRDQSLFSYTSDKINLYYNYFDNDQRSIDIQNTICALPKTYFNSSPQGNYSVLILSSQFMKKSHITFAIDYASDDLVSKLKYTSFQFKALTIQDLFQETFTKPYSYIFEKAIQSGDNQIIIKNFCLHDKEKYVMLFHFYGLAVFSNCSAKIFAKIEEAKEQITLDSNKKTKRKQSKKRLKRKRDIESLCGKCFLFTSKTGKIVSICRDFESLLFLSPFIIKKYQVNIRDILQVETLGKDGEFEKDFTMILDNIIQLNNNETCHADEDEFSHALNQIKEMRNLLLQEKINLVLEYNFEEKRIKKAPGKEKKYYLFVLSIKSNGDISKFNMTIMPGEFNMEKTIGGDINDYTEHSGFPTKKTLPYIQKYEQCVYHSTNAYDIQEKITLIREFILKYLYLKYNYNTFALFKNKTEDDYLNDLKETKGITIQQKDNDLLSTNNNNITKMTIASQPSTASILSKPSSQHVMFLGPNTPQQPKHPDTKTFLINYNNHIFFPSFNHCKQYYIYALVICYLLAAVTILLKKIDNLYNEIETINNYCDVFFLRSSLNGIVSTVLYLLLQSNNLQPEIIDNGFNNSYDYYQEELSHQNSDSIVYLQTITTFFLKNYYYAMESFMKDLSKPFNIITIDRFNHFMNESITFQSIQNWPLLVRPITNSHRHPLLFNLTGQPISNDLDNFYSNQAYVKIIFNFLGSLKMLYDETVNSFPNLVVKGWMDVQKLYCYTLLGTTVLFVLVSFIQMMIVFKYQKLQFIKYSITFAQLRFFFLVLMQKTQGIKHYIENNNEKGNNQTKMKIEIANEIEENIKLKKILVNAIDNLNGISIKPFGLKNNTNTINIPIMTKRNAVPMINHPIVNLQNASKLSSRHFSSEKVKNLSQNKIIVNINSDTTNNNNVTPGVDPPINNLSPRNSKVTQRKSNLHIPNGLDSPESLSSKMMFQVGGKSSKKMPKNSQTITSQNNKENQNPHITHHATKRNAIQIAPPPPQQINDHEGKKLLHQSNNRYYDSLIILTILILLFCSSILCVLNTLFTLSSSTQILKTEAIIFGQMNTITEMLLVYQISVLQNEELIVNYTSLGYLNNCDDTKYVNNITFHNVFQEATQCYSSFRKSINNITNSNLKTNFNTIKTLQESLGSTTSCESISEFYQTNKNDLLFPKLESLNTLTAERLLTNCKNIGNGFNSKGIINAMDSMFISIQSSYDSFLSDKARTAESNYARLNSHEIQIFQAEVYHIFNKLSIFFVIGFVKDFKTFDLKVIFNDSAVAILQLVIIIILVIYYMIIIKKYNSKEDLIQFFDARVLRSLLY